MCWCCGRRWTCGDSDVAGGGARTSAAIEAGVRTKVGLVVDTASAWHEHHVACQLGFGADAVHPWMALEWAWRISEQEEGCTPDAQGERFRKVVHKGVIKVMSKMGICAITSYIGAGLFEILGLDKEVVDRFFPGAAHWGTGVSLADLVEDVLAYHRAAYGDVRAATLAAAGGAAVQTVEGPGKEGAKRPNRPSLVEQGFVRYRKGGVPRLRAESILNPPQGGGRDAGGDGMLPCL